MNILSFDELPAMPKTQIAIVLIGAGEIARVAHLPAYRKAGLDVRAVYDRDIGQAEALARDFSINKVARSLEEAVELAGDSAVFDLAIPPEQSLRTLPNLPEGSGVLIQKPMGSSLDQARVIRDTCRLTRLRAAINLQLRFAPVMKVAKSLVDAGYIGKLYNMEFRVVAYSPSLVWSHIERMPRVEFVYYAIHYFDVIRFFMGNPRRVYARTVKHRQGETSAATRSCTIFDFGDSRMATVVTNHHRAFDAQYQESCVRWEGDRGLIQARFQPNAQSPEKGPDVVEYCCTAEDKAVVWHHVPVSGKWVPDAFIGSMTSLLRFVEGSSTELPTSVEDAYKTMSVVEAAYESNESGGTEIDYEEPELASINA